MPIAFICDKGAASVSDSQMDRLKNGLPQVLAKEFSISESDSLRRGFKPESVKVINVHFDPRFSSDVPLAIIAFLPEYPETFTSFEERWRRTAKAIDRILLGRVDFHLEIILSTASGSVFEGKVIAKVARQGRAVG